MPRQLGSAVATSVALLVALVHVVPQSGRREQMGQFCLIFLGMAIIKILIKKRLKIKNPLAGYVG